MKLYFILILFLFGFASFGISQNEETSPQSEEVPVVTYEQVYSSGSIDKPIVQNPAMDLIEKNGGLIFAEVTLIGNLTHVFAGKVNNSDFDKAIEIVKTKEFVESFTKINTTEYQVVFVHGVLDDQQRQFYELLGYSGYLFKKK